MLVAPLPSVAHCWGEKASFLELLPFHPSCREMPEKPAFLSLPPCLAHEQRNKQRLPTLFVLWLPGGRLGPERWRSCKRPLLVGSAGHRVRAPAGDQPHSGPQWEEKAWTLQSFRPGFKPQFCYLHAV